MHLTTPGAVQRRLKSAFGSLVRVSPIGGWSAFTKMVLPETGRSGNETVVNVRERTITVRINVAAQVVFIATR